MAAATTGELKEYVYRPRICYVCKDIILYGVWALVKDDPNLPGMGYTVSRHPDCEPIPEEKQ